MGVADLLAFGGPWNGKVMTVPDDRFTVLAPVDHKVTATYDRHATTIDETFRTGTYTVEKIGFHDPDACLNIFTHDARCQWSGRCLVYDGYPKDRIVAVMNVIICIALTVRGYRAAPTS